MQTVTIEIEAQVGWIVFQDPKSNRWVGVCDALKITVGDDTWSGLAETIDDAIQSLMLDLVEHGEFEGFLREHGWRPLAPLPKKMNKLVRFELPMQINKVPWRDSQVPCYQ